MRATTGRVNIVGECYHLGLFAFKRPGRNANVYLTLRGLDGLFQQHRVHNRRTQFTGVQIKNANERVGEKRYLGGFAIPFVANDKRQAWVQIRHQLQPLIDCIDVEGVMHHLGGTFPAVFVVHRVPENRLIRPKANKRAVAFLRFELFQFRHRFTAVFKILTPKKTVLHNAHLKTGRQRVYHRGTHPVQPTGRLVRAAILVIVKFAPGVQLRNRHGCGRNTFFGMNPRRNATAIVLDAQGTILVKHHLDLGTETGHRFVHGVVDDFPYTMVQATRSGIPNIHTGAFTDGFEAFKLLDHGCAVLGIACGIGMSSGCCHRSFSGLNVKTAKRKPL